MTPIQASKKRPSHGMALPEGTRRAGAMVREGCLGHWPRGRRRTRTNRRVHGCCDDPHPPDAPFARRTGSTAEPPNVSRFLGILLIRWSSKYVRHLNDSASGLTIHTPSQDDYPRMGGISAHLEAVVSVVPLEPRARESTLRMRWAVLSAVAFCLAGASRPALSDDCMKVDVWITWSDGAPTYVTPWPSESCVVPTPGWTEAVPTSGGHQEHWMPPGLPNGVRWKASVTSP